MESEIVNFGTYLEDCLKANKESDAEKIIKYIGSYLDENVGGSTLNYIISKVFDDDFNLLKFLNKIAGLKWKLLSSGYDLLLHFLKNFKENMHPYASEISKTCVRISMSNASAFDKVKYVDLLCYILKEGYDLPLNEVEDIYNQFFKFCSVHQKDTSAQLQKKIFTLLGIIGKNYSSIISNYESLVNKYVCELTSQSRLQENKREKNVISGCMDGLSNLLDTFSIEDAQTKSNIYGITKKLLMLDSDKKTYDARDVVSFVSKHCDLLSIHLYEDNPQLWHKKIIEFTTSANSDNRKAGLLALETFYGEMARILHTRTEERDKKIFEYFYEYFLKTMQNSFLDLVEIRLAIKGFGIFSAPSEVHMKQGKLTEMFIIIVVRLENDYFTSDSLSAEQLEYLPDYIHCFSTILHQIGEYSPDQIESLQKISVLMIKSFPKLSSLFYYSVYDSLILTMCYLHQYNSKCLRDYLQHVIYQGVLWSCSHRTTFDVDLDVNEDDGHNTTTYKSYVSLWKNLLSFSTSKNPKYASISIATRELVVQAVYDELIKTLLQLINKLNYKTKFLDEDVPLIDPSTSEAEKLDDYIIFINVVELYSTLLPTNYNCFKKWIKMYSTQIIFLSLKYPFVSGFYKLLRIAFQISDQLNYFMESKLVLEDRKKSFQTLQSFLQKVVLNVQEYKDDLQISCLQLLLSMPITFVPRLLHSMDSIFSMALSVGRGYLKLAEYAVDTLDKWYQILPEEDLKPVLKSVLPHFDSFLRSKGFTGDPDVKLSLLQGKKPKRTKRKVIIENDGELVNLQHKILMFLGQLNSELCNFMVESNMDVVEVPWESEPQLKFTLPYKEVKPNIYLDRLVPRVLELAISSGDQKTRITACELLHSIVIFMLGTSRKMSITKQKELIKLFEKLMLPLIQLGCDSNEVVRQLFNPLVFQIVHWYSNPLQFLSSETSILVEILMDGVSHPSNTSVRDLCGKCVKDFVKWTIKQLKDGELEKFTANIKTVVSKISLYLVHPNSFKRLGATLAFNNIYTELREEESMIDLYWFQLLHSLMFSFSLQSSQANNNQIEQALKHIERVLRQKRILFNTYSDKRIVPSGMDGPLMKDVVFWILQQTGSINLNYRRTSVKLFCSLAAYVDDSATAHDFIFKFVESDDADWFLKLYEENGIKEITTLNDISLELNVDLVIKWLKNLIRCLDAYKYLLDYKIVTYDKIIKSSKIHQALNFYIQQINNKSLGNVMELFAANICTEQIFLAEEIDEYNQIKDLVNIAIYDYFITVLDKTTSWSTEIDTSYFWSYLSSNIFLTATNVEESEEKLENLLYKLFEKLPEDIQSDFKQHLTNYFTSNFVGLPLKSLNNIPLLQRNLLKGWILLNNCGFKINLPATLNTNILDYIFDGLIDRKEIDYGKKLSPTLEEYSKLLLKIYFTDPGHLISFCNSLTKNTLIKDPDNFTLIATGDYFMKCYEDVVLEYILENLEDVTNILFNNKDLPKLTRQTEVLKNILFSYSNNATLKKKFRNLNIMEIILRNSERVFEVSPDTQLSDRKQQIDLLLHVIKIDQNKNTDIGKNIKYFNTWFINNLNYYPEIPDKNILQFKITLLEFLHCTTGQEEDDNYHNFRSAFEKLNNYNNELEKTNHVLIFNSLLNQLFKSKSRIIIEPVLDSFLKVQHENINLNMDEKMHSYLSSINSIDQYKSINLIYELISSHKFDASGCYKIAKMFLLPMLRSCSYEAFERFFIENIKEVFKTLKIKIQEDIIKLLTKKTVKFILLDVLFSRIKVSAFAEKNCTISKAAYGDHLITGKEILVETIKIIKSVRKEDIKIEDSEAEYYRLYQCEAFNALISAISNTKTLPEDVDIYYHIFVQSKDTGEYIWKRIIDCNKTILIQQCFDEWPKIRKTFINIRNENRTKQQLPSVQYVESQSLFNSTLSEDVSKFDFSNTVVRTPEILEAMTTFQVDNNFIEMEGIDINNHECMATVCGLVNYLIDSKISPLPSDFNQSPPKWLEALRVVLGAENTEKNVKIFLARMIHNMKFIFRYYSKHFFEPIVNFIVNGCAGEGINYFIADLLQMLLSWSHDLDLIDVKLPVNNLMSYLITNSHNERTHMLKSNLEIIKSCVEIWKQVIHVPHDQVFDILCSNNKKLLGVQLVGIILANDLIPWTNDNIERFNRTLVNNLKREKLKTIFKPTAEVLGMILNKINLDENLKVQRKILNDDVEDVLMHADTNKLYNSLEQIQIHFPQIIDKFLRRIVTKMFSEKQPSLICICLKNVLRRIDTLDIPLLSVKDLINYLNMDDADLKLLSLQVINKMINSIKKELLPSVVNAVVEHKTNSSPMIRNAVYDILITIYKEFFLEETEVSKQLISICKPILLSGVIDSDIELQEKILKFWCIDRFQMLTLSERFEKSLLDLYSPETESYYLGYVNYYLLEGCKDTPEYDKLMFDHPLSECEFDDYQLLINWRAQHASMAPMFANTQQDFLPNMAVPQINAVRATTSARIFTPTISSIDLSSSLDTASSFMFSPIASTGSSSNLNNYSPQLQNNERSLHNSHSKRFLSNASKIRLEFSKAATDKKQKTEQQRRERIRRKEGNVVMYRQYRKGELPDIQIPNSAIIQPLQILARRDGYLARQLYVLLFKGLVTETKNSDNFIASYNTGVESVLQQTHLFTPNVIGALLDIILQHNKKRGLKKIDINPDILFTACKNSGLLSVGCLLLEEYINLNDDYDGPSSSKRGCAIEDKTVDYWVKLADMYKELNEWDTVVGIFSSTHMDCSVEVSQAIAAEANSDWMEASKKYKNLLYTDTNYSRKDFYYESYYKCYSNLSDWDGISKSITQTFDDSLWDKDFNQEKILPWYILGEMCSILDGASNNSILQQLSNWMKDREKADYLKDKFSAELAILALIRKDVNASKHYTQNCFSKFLEEWSNQNPLFFKIRAKTLMNFQKMIDIKKYLSCGEEDVLNQITYFERNCDLNSNSVIESEIRTLCRYLVLRSFEEKLTDLNMEEHSPSLQDLKLTSDLSLIAFSLENNNCFVAKKYCKKNGRYFKSIDNPLARYKLINSMAKIGIMTAELAENDEKMSKLIYTWKLLESNSTKCPETYVDLKIESLQILSQISQNVYGVLKNSPDLTLANKKDIEPLISVEGSYPDNLLNYSKDSLKAAITLGEKYSQSQNNKILNGLTQAYLSFVAFAQQQDPMYAEEIVKCVLRGMKIGSKNARQLFPCLLVMENLETSLLKIFKEESLSVPTWMFILWIPQLFASLNTSKYLAFEDIVTRLAITYPQALIYPYKIAKERRDLKSGDNYFHQTISRLDELLKHELAEKILFELSCLCVPELYLKYHLLKIFKNVDSINIKNDLRDLEENIAKKLDSSRNFKSIEDSFKRFQKKNTGRIILETLKQNLKNYITENNSRINALKKRYNFLEQCSPWLSTFQATKWTEELEIPGQYTGDTKPLVKYHSKISSFSNKISMWSSLRKPIKIVIYGNDAKEYPFIVKFGEDVRQDQRIQQLFSLSNSILLSDSSCQQRNLFLEQYQVIPLTTSLGLIQMLENNSGLGAFMFKTVDKKVEEQCSLKICDKYVKWIKGDQPEHFWKACQTRSKDETNQVFTGFVSDVPTNMLSESFWAISLDTESYAFRRNQFIVSYSTMCLVHWLLGIGDRNLDNCLVLLKTGRAVGIDFGCAFGTATQHFPIPELIPFRLTPHILSLMEPLRNIGFVEQTMIHCLRALRKQKHILLSTMNIFIRDPSVDWLELAKKAENCNIRSDWYPTQKIAIAERKLDGANPANIIIDELKINVALIDKKVLKAYCEIVKGDANNIRCNLPEKGLSEEDQVKALLDQATDYNILGRMYYGLRLWI